MKITASKNYDGKNCLVVPILENKKNSTNLPKVISDYISLAHNQKVISSENGSTHSTFIEVNKKLQLLILLGVGKKPTDNDLRQTIGKVAPLLKKHKINSINLDCFHKLNSEAFIEGLILAQYTYDECKTDKPKKDTIETIKLIGADKNKLQSCQDAKIVCEATNWTRLLSDLPGNKMTPKILAKQAKSMAKELELKYEILEEKDMKKLGMNALLAVSAGSKEEARLILLKHTHPKAKKTISLVGKGLTFDAGGISIKGSRNMHQMKYDMCGGAAVLGAMKAIKQLNLPINVIAAVPSSENLINGKAVKPGDVVTAYNGKTISIHNTDAEGRLILADTLSYVCDKYKPDAIVNAATLTGAVIVCLGHHLAAVVSENQTLTNQLIKAGNTTYERLWQMPLNDDYKELMKGKDADFCNIGPPEAGTVTAGAFLSNFVDNRPWAHLDIAGVAWGMKGASYISQENASGFGTRLFTQWAKDLCQ